MIRYKYIINNITIPVFLFIIFGILAVQLAGAQEKPPRPITITTYQDLNFGAIIQGFSGGTVTIYPNGSRTHTGDLILPAIGLQGNEAIFGIKAPPGTLINVVFGPCKLSNGSYNMNVQLGNPNSTDPVSPIIISRIQNESTLLHVGGTLTVGNTQQNPSGNYSGTFTITFIKE